MTLELLSSQQSNQRVQGERLIARQSHLEGVFRDSMRAKGWEVQAELLGASNSDVVNAGIQLAQEAGTNRQRVLERLARNVHPGVLATVLRSQGEKLSSIPAKEVVVFMSHPDPEVRDMIFHALPNHASKAGTETQGEETRIGGQRTEGQRGAHPTSKASDRGQDGTCHKGSRRR